MTGVRTRIDTPDGVVQGVVSGGVRCWYSLPYAAPVTPERRFQKPQPVERWAGVRDASAPGATTPQSTPPAFEDMDVTALYGPTVEGPDFLTLNVFSPTEDKTAVPVMLFIHGGSFISGGKDVPLYDGRGLARDGVVCVVINYRLGIEGFLPIPDVPTNLGLRDMIAAMTWVRDNIAAFGGDPGNVTLFGESGGGCCVSVLMTSPLAQPFFQRAIVQSGHGMISRDISRMQKVVKRIAKKAGIPATREGFLSKSTRELLDVQAWVMKLSLFLSMRDKDGRDPGFGMTRFQPVHGDDVLPMNTAEALKNGAGRQIDLLIGATTDEVNAFTAPGNAAAKIKAWQAPLLVGVGMPRARQALKAYGLGQKGSSAGEVMTRALTDLMFRWPTRRMAEMHGRAHVFEFDWPSPALNGRLGAAHAVDVPFVFDTLEVASGPRNFLGPNPPQALSDSIRALWVRFARDGFAPWPSYSPDTRLVYSLTRQVAAPEAIMPAAAFLP
ncbi:carboxylesterase family protein [soil metagenome]